MKSRAAIIFWILVHVATARADDKAVAREAFQQGTLHYEIGDFRAALAQFKKAYLSYPDPAILFNIAQCQRQLGDKSEAARTFRLYLQKVPDSPERAQVERLVGELQKMLDAERTTPRSAPAKPVAVSAPIPSPEPTLHQGTAPPRTPLVKKGWFWGALAGAAVIVGGAVALGVVYGSPRHYIEVSF